MSVARRRVHCGRLILGPWLSVSSNQAAPCPQRAPQTRIPCLFAFLPRAPRCGIFTHQPRAFHSQAIRAGRMLCASGTHH
ncbi:hypothetical protein LZ30DRAFT_742408 [Colletotrichum cereale]|nr:hypothetical protein LZ30DRAFT_742408 [Colletotrichum cereale]